MNSLPHLSPVWWKSSDLVATSGSGMYLSTADGRTLLDFTSGVGVTSTGHSHPDVVAELHEQMSRIMHAQVNLMSHDQLGPATEALNAITPQSIDQFFITNSGAEAVEAAVKLAKHATRRSNLIVFERGFHGRTAQTMAMTSSKSAYRAGYAPLPGGIFFAPLPYPFRSRQTQQEADRAALAHLEFMLRSTTAASETAAIVIEPVLGEGGFVVHSTEFLRGLRDICNREGILLVLDEIQCGVGRTGKWFAFEHHGIEPDILILGKGIGSGFPVACIGASSDLMSRWHRGSHGGTYGANPVACRAILATQGVIKREGLLANADDRGKQLLEGVKSTMQDSPRVGDIRGLGLMVGIEIVDADGNPDGAMASEIMRRCLEQDVLLISCGLDGNVIRLIPSLIVDDAQVDRVVDVMSANLY